MGRSARAALRRCESQCRSEYGADERPGVALTAKRPAALHGANHPASPPAPGTPGPLSGGNFPTPIITPFLADVNPEDADRTKVAARVAGVKEFPVSVGRDAGHASSGRGPAGSALLAQQAPAAGVPGEIRGAVGTLDSVSPLLALVAKAGNGLCHRLSLLIGRADMEAAFSVEFPANRIPLKVPSPCRLDMPVRT